jgi:hypothetical protein
VALCVKKKELTQRKSGGPQRDTEVAFVNSEVFAFEIFVVKKKRLTQRSAETQ